ncbi:MAG: hypothetical protein KZQ90_12125 [Candidatus Thiodiazotropha sp. (ex Codakia rugifera)]|nr:hypothetical protein [Candidatus Thiodiazotropha sp. (ex Codakia rugifera)]
MLNQKLDFSPTPWVSCGGLHEFVKNSNEPSDAVVLVKGIANNGKRHLAGHAGISHKSMFNCGF